MNSKRDNTGSRHDEDESRRPDLREECERLRRENEHLRKESADVTRSLSAALQKAEKARDAKSRFLASMSHEIRTPMNGIIGLTELMLINEVSSGQRNSLKKIRHSANNLLHIINEILDISKIESGMLSIEEEEVCLRTCMEELLDVVSPEAGARGIELALRVEADVPDIIRSDFVRLQQIVLNFLSNAVKFTRRGQVVARVENAGQKPDSVKLRFSVSDTGIGIPENKIRTIFDPYSQAERSTTRKFGGTGLGLVIAAELAELMGGRIGVESRVGRGSVFHFEASFRCEESTSGRKADCSRMKDQAVMVVAQDSLHVDILEELLTRFGLKSNRFATASEALDRILENRKIGEPVPLIIVDADLPDEEAFTLINEIRTGTDEPDPPGCIVMSGNPPAIENLCEELEIYHRIGKPVKESRLLQSLVSLFDKITEDPLETVATNHSIPMNSRSLCILLAEDDEINQMVASELLKALGHKIIIAGDGREAVDAFRNHAFDMIFMDVQMPFMNGIEATKAIREMEKTRESHIHVIALTANAMRGDDALCLDAGMDGYMTKPVTPKELFEKIESFIRQGSEVAG